ncbi:MAG TPA: hypothetical protein VNA32_10185 [Actinomycetota bacterium]|nr:hypothetical protein [Actinomycetota bacterium]
MSTNYEFPSRVAKDPTLDVLIKDGVGFIYALDDTSHSTPLSVTDRYGVSKPNVRTTFDGVTEEFFVLDKPIVWWASGPYAFLIVSFTGLRDAAVAAAADAASSLAAATAAAAAAAASATAATGPADATVADLINNPASLLRLALDPIAPVIAAKVTTVDTFEDRKIVSYADGTVKAIPRTATAPAQPAAPTVVSGASMVRVSWTAVTGGVTYALYRSGTEIARSANVSFLDRTGLLGSTYTYTVAAFDAYGQRSVTSLGTNGSFDGSLNVNPTVEVRTWPATIPTTGTVLVRVNAKDADAQTLALTLGADVGSLMPTQDPSVWIYSI